MIKVRSDESIYELNDENNTATLYHSYCICKVKRSVTFDSKEYLVVGVKEGSLEEIQPHSTHIFSYSDDVEISTIGKNTFINSPHVSEIIISPSIKKFEDGWSNSINNVDNIYISPQNNNFKIVDEKYLVGKSNQQSDIFDILLLGYRNIVNAKVPSYITYISPFCFSNCNHLNSFIIPENSKLHTIGYDAFNGSPIKHLYIPSQLTKLTDGWCANTSVLNDIEISPNNRNFKLIDNKMVVGKSDTNKEEFDVLEFACRDIKEAKIPSYIKCISPFCFDKCKGIKKVCFGKDSNIKTIKNDAFSDTYIESLYIPSKLTELTDGWCENTPILNDITISTNNKSFKLINKKMIVGKSDQSKKEFDVLIFACRDIKEAKIPSYIKYISPYCFENCNLLQKVEFSKDSKLISIGKYAFHESFIESISIPKNCEQIQEGAFFECTLLKTIEFTDDSKLKSIEEKAFSKSSLKIINIPKHVKIIGKDAFSKCSLLINVIFHKNSELNSIGEQSFMNSSLIDIKIPDNVNQIDKRAFYECINLRNVELSKNSNLVSIEYETFYHTSISSIFIPSKTKYIQPHAFVNCYNLSKVKFANKSELFYIGDSAFFSTSIGKFVVPSSVKFIDSYVFEHSQNVNLQYEKNSQIRTIKAISKNEKKLLTIPDNVSKIEVDHVYNEKENITQILLSPRNKNFKLIDDKIIAGKSDLNNNEFDVLVFSCRDIKEVIIPSYIKHIAPFCFDQCSELYKVEFSSNSKLTSIDEHAFASTKIEKFTIPNNLKTIGKNAFLNCEKLTLFNISKNSELEFIDEDAFKNTLIKNIFIPKNFKANSLQFFCKSLESVSISTENKNFKLIDKKMVVVKSEENKKDFDTLAFGFHNITKAFIPKYIKYISKFCFFDCKNLQEVEFEDNSELLSIGQYSFYNTSIESITIPIHLKKIESFAFSNSKIISITFHNNAEIEIIENDAFKYSSINFIKYPDCLKTIEKNVFAACKELKTIQFSPNSQLTIIDYNAFSNSSIEKITIPSHVKSIKPYAFSWCTNLKTVLFDKNSELTEIGYDAFGNANIERITIPKHVKYIYPLAFNECKNLVNIEFEPKSELEIIDEQAFYGISANDIQIPKNVRKILKGCFAENMNLHKFEIEKNSEMIYYDLTATYDTNVTQINIPSKVENINLLTYYCDIEKVKISPNNKYYKSINDDQLILQNSYNSFDTVYTSCHKIENATIPSNVKYISPNCFSNQIDLKKIEFPKNSELQTIFNSTFSSSGIEKITIPSHVQSIANLFNKCNNLKTVDFAPNSELRKIGKCTFPEYIEKISIPADVIDLEDGWCADIKNLIQVSISPKNKNFKLIDNAIIVGKSNPNNDVFDVLEFAYRDIVEACIPSYIKYISSCCFENCKILETIRFTENSQLIKIGDYAFNKSSINQLSIPKHCKDLGYFCFTIQSILKTIEFHENSELEFIPKYSFAESNIIGIIFPQNVYMTENEAFLECKYLECISFLGDFVCLQDYTFKSCNNLSLVEFPNASKVQIYKNTFQNPNTIIFTRQNIEIQNI